MNLKSWVIAFLVVVPAVVIAVPSTGGTSLPSWLKIDRANQRLGIGTSSPTTPLDVAGVIRSSTGGFKFPDGSTQISAASASGTASVTLGTVTAAANVNLSTEGTTDWLSSEASTSQIPFTTFIDRKSAGQDTMARSFAFVTGGNTITILGGTDGPFTKSSTLGDSIAGTALSSVKYSAPFSATGGALNYGWRFDVQCKTSSQTLALYMGVFSGTATVSATLPDGETASTTVASAQKRVPFTFTCARPSDTLRIKSVLTTNGGSSPNVQFYAATLF